MNNEIDPPAIAVESPETSPVAMIKPDELKQLGQKLTRDFDRYASDRLVAEQRWLKNLRQYLGQYDPEITSKLSADRSKAYPRVTRVKCISVLSRVMNLMFPGNEQNWELKASPNAEMAPEDVQAAMQKAMKAQQELGLPPAADEEMMDAAVQQLADERAADLSELIADQLEELGGDQTQDHIALSRAVVKSGILYGLGVLIGPMVKTERRTVWSPDPATQQPVPQVLESYKPVYEFLPVWDFYPDMSAKNFISQDGYFTRSVMTRSQVRKLADRPDFIGASIKQYLKDNVDGNYSPRQYETELRGMGNKINAEAMGADRGKYEVLVWHGPISGTMLAAAGAEVDPDKMADEFDADVWMIGSNVIKADINPWKKLGVDVRTLHTFLFDEDDTSPVGNGLPNVMRDSQMSIAAATRMLLDNASVICGPNMEVNIDLLRSDQEMSSVHAYKVWYREGGTSDAAYPAVRNIQIDGHLSELMAMIDMFMRFADMETFVGPMTGGDMEHKAPSEPMRTAAGASMMRGDAALPFKDIVRNFDTFTQSMITSLVQFNRKFNPSKVAEGDFNVIARGATSLIAKEVRGMQLDQLAVSMTPEERMHVDERKMVEARFRVRDLSGLLVPASEAKRRQEAANQQLQARQAQETEAQTAVNRKTLADAVKAISQSNKNTANADATTSKAALELIEKGMPDESGSEDKAK